MAIGRGSDREDEFTAWAAARRSILLRGAFLLCGDWATAEDLVQDALMKVYVAWPRAVVRSPDAYARQVVLNTYLDLRRRPWRRRERTIGDLPEQAAPLGPAHAEIDALQSALRALAPRQRATVVLRHWFGLSVEETAHELGCSTGTVKSQTADAIRLLRSSLTEADERSDRVVTLRP